MADPDNLKYYDLEGYLFGDVSERFRRDGYLSAFDFFCIVIWKANRSKSRIARRLLEKCRHSDLESAVKTLTAEIGPAVNPEERLRVLMEEWGFRLPMASAILTVLYAEDFTVYDVRVCAELRDFKGVSEKKFAELWPLYRSYIERVKAEVPGNLSLRDKDRCLWASSFKKQLENDIAAGFRTGIANSTNSRVN